MKKLTLPIVLIIAFLTSSLILQDSVQFKEKERLNTYYNFKNVKEIYFWGWKGKHKLSKSKSDLLIQDLNTFYCAGHYADTKPGHLEGLIYFNDGGSLYFYSSGESDAVIPCSSNKYVTFKSKIKINFEKY